MNKHVPIKIRRLDFSNAADVAAYRAECKVVRQRFGLSASAKYITVEQAAEYLGITPATLRRHAREDVSQFKRKVVSRNEKTNKYVILIDIEGAVQYKLVPRTRRR